MNNVIDFLLNMDQYLNTIAGSYGYLIYAILFAVVFCETGLVVTPFLPGDSIIFTCGALAAIGQVNIFLVLAVFAAASILGDTVNYILGKRYGTMLVTKIGGRFIKERHMEEASLFYARYGGAAIFLGRFVPIIRTFVPFVAGISKMRYQKFVFYNIFGGLVWVALFSLTGFYFGNMPFIKSNFSIVILAIIFISVLPILIKYITSKKERKS
ncbi:VTT domain-containing protein [Sinanaerobacter chloroacetimidivorans]|uniref:VTT domain-containing protein n=1 Tax=Sinanaerobacter chloroacetimidivorans TaxID=2818044 RepID=A0A8J8B284_9FIRM|nr:VTT domain-containing protein [Sinanaerobacter chloroacetimidivorans]MBR0598462.1 VTT domain-containing protein [Sinanaerobacter chloroacetimidivorans]